MVNLQDTPSAGRLTDADMLTGTRLEEARRDNPGSIWHSPHRLHVCAPCNGDCVQGCCAATFVDTVPVAPYPAEFCTDIGADECHPPASRAGIALVVLPWLLGVIGWAVWARWPLF